MKSLLLTLIIASVSLTAAAQKKKDMKKDLNVPVIKLEHVRDLTLEKPLQDGRGAFVSAASGLVKIKDTFYIAADDETSLFSFDLKSKHLTPHGFITGNSSCREE